MTFASLAGLTRSLRDKYAFSPKKKQNDRIPPGLFVAAVREIYEVALKPQVIHEGYYDMRASRILGMQEFFQKAVFAQALPELVKDIVADLHRLMPTQEQIAASRCSSTDRYVDLKPIKLAST